MIQRYRFETYGDRLAQAVPDSVFGRYVLYDDHEAALAEKDAEIERLEEQVNEKEFDMHSRIRAEYDKAVAEAWKAALAAEKEKVRELVECLSSVRVLQEAIMNDRQSDLEFQHEQRCLARHAESLLRINTKVLIEKYSQGGTE